MSIVRAYRWWADRYCPKALTRRLGVRGFGMVLIGTAWTLIGVGVLHGLNPTPPDAPHLVIPAPVRGTVWIAPGVLAFALCASRRRDTIALTVAVVMPLVHVVSYTWAWVVYLAPGGQAGYSAGWYNGAFHLALVALVVLVASIVDVPTPREDA